MEAADHKLRIALTVFEPVSGVTPALTSLLANGVPLESVGLIALATTAARIVECVSKANGTGRPLSQLLDELVPLSRRPNGDPIVASPRLVRPWRSGWRIPALWSNERAGEEEPRLAADLERQVRKGAAILTIVSDTPDEQWLCTRILLERSTSPVLALECSLPAAS